MNWNQVWMDRMRVRRDAFNPVIEKIWRSLEKAQTPDERAKRLEEIYEIEDGEEYRILRRPMYAEPSFQQVQHLHRLLCAQDQAMEELLPRELYQQVEARADVIMREGLKIEENLEIKNGGSESES